MGTFSLKSVVIENTVTKQMDIDLSFIFCATNNEMFQVNLWSLKIQI